MITLREITADNYEDIINLSVTEGQRRYVSSNVHSLAQAKVQPECIPLAICSEDTLIGFVMYCIDHKDSEYWIYQFMIGADHQGKGYGKEALKQIIRKILEDKAHDIIYISFVPENEGARILYEKIGFVPDNRIIDGEVVYRLERSPKFE